MRHLNLLHCPSKLNETNHDGLTFWSLKPTCAVKNKLLTQSHCGEKAIIKRFRYWPFEYEPFGPLASDYFLR